MSNEDSTTFLNAVREILVVWNKFAQTVAIDGERGGDHAGQFWGDRGNPRNVIVDAEALLVFLYPESAVDRLSFHDRKGSIVASDTLAGESIAKVAVDIDYDDVLPGDAVRGIVRILSEFFEDNGGMAPEFVAGSYLDVVDDPTDAIVSTRGVVDKREFIAFNAEARQQGAAQENEPASGDIRTETLRRDVEVLDAYTYSISVSVSTLQLIERWFPDRDRYEGVDRLQELAHLRLTEALEGLVDSFSVSNVDKASWQAGTKRKWPASNNDLKAIRMRLAKLKPGIVIEDDDSAFEVGWSWGPVAPKHRILPAGEREHSHREYSYLARNVPFLYFTVGALDGLEDVLSVELQTASILSEREQELAYHLRILSDLASHYWTLIAFDESDGRWAIEDVPWTTIDGSASDYWTLFLLRVALPQLPDSDHHSGKLVDLAQELGQRARITRKPSPPASDSALSLHWPGEILVLDTYEELTGGKKLLWRVYDFSPQLLKLAGQLLEKMSSPRDRAEASDLIGQIWHHLTERREDYGNGRSTWDSLETVYKQWYKAEVKGALDTLDREEFSVNSWYMTERVVEGLVAVALGELSRPLVPMAMREFLFELISELDYQFATEDRTPGASHADLAKKRADVHVARRLLLERNSSGCMEQLVAVMSAAD